MKTVIEQTFYLMVQTQIYHWLTKNINVHETLGIFYEGLQKNVDALAENFLSNKNQLNGEFDLNFEYTYDEQKLMSLLTDYKVELEGHLDMEHPETIKDSLLVLLQLTDKTIYLLGFE